MSKSKVIGWVLDDELSNPCAQVWEASDLQNPTFKVTSKGNPPRCFFGESAWSDAQRYASDIQVKCMFL